MDHKSGLEKFLLKGIRVGIFLILFTPLFIGRFGISFSEFPKAVYFRSLTEFISISYLILLIQGGRQYLPRVKGRLIFFAVLAFMGVLALGTLFSINPIWSFWGTISRSLGLVTYLHFFAFFLVLVSTVKTKEDWLLLLQWAVFISGISSFTGILQKLNVASFYGISLPDRISGTLANPTFFGSYLVLNIFLGLFLLSLKDRTKGIRIALASVTGLNIVTLFLSGHRAGWAGAAVGFTVLGFVWFLRYFHQSKTVRRIFIFAVVSLGILTSLLFLNRERLSSSRNYLIRRVVSVFNVESALAGRLFIWEAIAKGWEEKPILGWGLETSAYPFDKYRDVGTTKSMASYSANMIFDRPHNKILEVASDVGVVGVMSYLFLFSATFYLIFKHRGRWGPVPSLVLSSLFVAYFVQNLGTFDTISSYLIFFLLLGFVNSNFAEVEEEVFKKKKKGSRSESKLSALLQELAIKSMAVLLILLPVVTFYVFNFRLSQINLEITQTQDLEQKDFPAALANYKKIGQQDTVIAADIRWHVTERLLLLMGVNKLKDFREEIAGILSGLTSDLEKDLAKPIPGYLRRHLLLSRAYEIIYIVDGSQEALDRMEETATRMREFNETYPDTYWYLGKVQIYRGNYEEGEALLEKVFNLGLLKTLKERVRNYSNLVGTYINAGNKTKAGENLEKIVDEIYSLVKKTSLENLTAGRLEWLKAQQPLVDTAAQFHLRELKDPETAIEIYKKAIFIYPLYKEVFQEKIDTIKEGL